MADIKLPDPAMSLHGKRGKQMTPESMDWYTADQMHYHAAAVSAADNAGLRERVKVLEDALRMAIKWIHLGVTKDEMDAIRASLEITPPPSPSPRS